MRPQSCGPQAPAHFLAHVIAALHMLLPAPAGHIIHSHTPWLMPLMPPPCYTGSAEGIGTSAKPQE